MDEIALVPSETDDGVPPRPDFDPQDVEPTTIIRDSAGNELRVSEVEGMLGFATNYENFTAESRIGGIRSFRVWSARSVRHTAHNNRSEREPSTAEKFDPQQFGVGLEVVHDDALQPGDVLVEPGPDSQILAVRTGGPKSRVKARLTPAGGVNVKMRRDDKRLVRIGWTPEEAQAIFGADVLVNTAEAARARGRSGTPPVPEGASVEAYPHMDEPEAEPRAQSAVPERADDTARPEPERDALPEDGVGPAASEDANEENGSDPAQRDRLHVRILQEMRRRLPRAFEVAALVAVAATLLAGDRAPGGYHTVAATGQTPGAALQEPLGPGRSGMLPPTHMVEIGPGDTLYNLVQQEVEQADPALADNGTERADVTRSMVLDAEQMNGTIDDWRDLHAGQEVKLYTPAAMRNMLDVLNHKPGADAPEYVQQQWQQLHDAHDGLMKVHGNHEQFDYDEFLKDPKVAGWINTENEFIQNGGWL